MRMDLDGGSRIRGLRGQSCTLGRNGYAIGFKILFELFVEVTELNLVPIDLLDSRLILRLHVLDDGRIIRILRKLLGVGCDNADDESISFRAAQKGNGLVLPLTGSFEITAFCVGRRKRIKLVRDLPRRHLARLSRFFHSALAVAVSRVRTGRLEPRERVADSGIVGIDLQNFFVVCNGLRVFPLFLVGNTPFDVCVDEVGINSNRNSERILDADWSNWISQQAGRM